MINLIGVLEGAHLQMDQTTKKELRMGVWGFYDYSSYAQ